MGIDLLGVISTEGDKAVEKILVGCSDRRPSCYSWSEANSLDLTSMSAIPV